MPALDAEKQLTTAASSTQGHGDQHYEADPKHERRAPQTWREFLMADVDPSDASGPLAAYCFMTGYIDVISFSAIFVWCGFQTGNFAQLGMAIARLWEGAPDEPHFHTADQQALCSLIAFNAGAFVGRIGDRMGARSRAWLALGTFLQALMTMAGAVAFWKSGQFVLATDREYPAWTNALSFVGLAFISASLGLQGVLGKRLNTPFGTTIVLTTVWVELMTDPKLFSVRHRVPSRDVRLLAAGALFLGAFVGRAILAPLGYAGTLGVAVGFKVLIAGWWLLIRDTRAKTAPSAA